jgi:hypothetical protein
MGPIEVTSANYTMAISLASIPVAVCAANGSTTAGKRFLRNAKQIGKKLGDDVLVATVDTHSEPKVAAGLKIGDDPTILVMNSGYILARSTDLEGTQNITRFVYDELNRARIKLGVHKKRGFLNWLMDF